MSHKYKHLFTGVICATVGIGIVYVVRKYHGNLLQKLKKIASVSYVSDSKVVVVSSFEECQLVAKKLLRRCSSYHVVGFDCEWVTQNDKRHPVALMQLASHDGYCALIRLCHLKEIPESLKELLQDVDIYKVGVAPSDDARYLQQDYGLVVRGCVDLRHISDKLGRGGLSGMAQHYLGVQMDKSWRIRCSDWEASELSERQVQYASQDALIAMRIFSQLMRPWWWFSWERVQRTCGRFVDVKYKSKPSRVGVTGGQHPVKSTFRAFSTRQRPLYDNCILQAPDGEVLSTCDHRKAEWYVAKGLGEIVGSDPLTVRLNFEPSGRAEGEVGQYYTTEKANQCVVCGKTESYIRKNVVPHEYRKYFPPVMKDHMSHDILLLCLDCHLINNTHDTALRLQLAEECNAPVGDSKVFEDPQLKKVRSAARALLSANAHKIPLERQKELKEIVLSHFGKEDEGQITPELLRHANDIAVGEVNASYEPHGRRVVLHFAQNGGLMQLEQRWREHFLAAMRPQYLPPLWSVTFNHSRLSQRIAQGRILPEEMSVAGLNS